MQFTSDMKNRLDRSIRPQLTVMPYNTVDEATKLQTWDVKFGRFLYKKNEVVKIG